MYGELLYIVLNYLILTSLAFSIQKHKAIGTLDSYFRALISRLLPNLFLSFQPFPQFFFLTKL